MLNKLEAGKKYTIVGNDGFLEFKIQVTLIDFMYKQYAQYEAVPFITFKKKGGRKVNQMFLNYQYSFIEGWQDIKMTKEIDNISHSRIKYNDLKLDNVVVSGRAGEVEPYRSYESLIDYSFNFGLEYGVRSEAYTKALKEIFTKLNFSLSNDMIKYYKEEHPYFLSSLELLK